MWRRMRRKEDGGRMSSSTSGAGPSEATVKVLRMFLIGVGIAAMATVMWMTGRFGWSLQEADADRWASAILHILGDAAGAGLVAVSSVMLGWPMWRWRIMGGLALVCALVLVVYSVVSVYGFMSTRIAHLHSHNATVEIERGDLAWKRGTAVLGPRADRAVMRKEVRDATERLKKSIAFVPDAQAAGIAAWIGTSTEHVQRGLVVTTSCVGQLIKVSCLFFGFSLCSQRSSKISIASTDADDAASGGSGGGKKRIRLVGDTGDADKKVPAKSAMQAASDQPAAASRSVPDTSVPAAAAKPKMSTGELAAYLRSHASGMSQRQIARETGWSQPTVCRKSRQVRRQEERMARKAGRGEASSMNGFQGLGGVLHAPAAA